MPNVPERAERIREEIAELGPVLPGGISKHWNVCGKPGCRCKDPDHPQKHGPYYQLSFTVGGRSSSIFLSGSQVGAARRCVRRYARLKRLIQELLNLYVGWARQGGLREGEDKGQA